MTALVQMTGIEKRFPGVHALKDVHLEILPGEVHAVMGENGAGKSTLMKILSGIYPRDGGEIEVEGNAVEIDGPRAAQDLGIGIIHQELSLMNDLTIAQNIFIGREPRRRFGRLDEAALNRQAADIFAGMNLKLDPRTKVERLTIAKQQMVEIAKALSFRSRILIMDEPTAALNDVEIEELFIIIRRLKAEGVGIVYISHKMDELKRIADRVTVMRDGETVGTVSAADTPVSRIIAMMVGRALSDEAAAQPDLSAAKIALEVRGLSRGREIRDVSFAVKKGEILGFAGLMGAGRTEVARAIFGADPRDCGDILVHGRTCSIRSPADAVKAGIGYLSEDRKHFGLAVSMDVRANIAIASLDRFTSRAGMLDENGMGEAARRYIDRLGIRTPSDRQEVRLLSGGNQQKVVIAKWLLRDCDILIFDEPTRGIDVGAKSEIYKLLNSLAEQGRAIIVISSELPEILRLSHRIAVMCEGRLTGILPGGSGTSQEDIMRLATMRESAMEPVGEHA
ncbi:sugar ABC transporter ATP-binding protein [Aurantimonas sp. C2-6-R+9]|uniref:sugar ABC transporter ATP-binding protein n=1 Tax=unclassified Aurantimonas TaxID=2638230 RepID=UPI002E17B89C|nr:MULTISPECIES: sugar ABC transporter ATP-binding protein [unclassified Aurantimonas]MEC5291854.1 sugar ABC transporter ATP-binding protein [Aurantimonas sp. C2-3-R2]MEC5381993.1 sugar ABC transporter ATP-binding protein [Aurantimonas sp. C2-6-R+9]MEC5412930.1 sugar ABC transporter ATP-binding protein [Aurantimonas sp. C2-4-R8]